MNSLEATLEANAWSRALYGIAPLIDMMIGTERVDAPRQGFGYSRFQGAARMSVLCASSMSNAVLTTRRLRS